MSILITKHYHFTNYTISSELEEVWKVKTIIQEVEMMVLKDIKASQSFQGVLSSYISFGK